MNLKDTYNKIAEDWSKDHYADTWWVEGTERFVSFLSPGSSVLDVGCGTGVKSKYLLGKGLRVTGVDFSEKMIEIARREVPQGLFEVVDIMDMGSLEKTFDGILAQAVLLHIPKAQIISVIKGLKNKLTRGGYLYIAVKEKREGGLEEEIVVEQDYGYTYERFFSFYTLPEIKQYLLSLGMEVCYENVALSGKTNWIQVIAKKV
jgi:cyclopropane fatty-acyl-phospholipid synthase-like methyltransferase